MKLINTDGLSLIGPGSEWFWTALSGVILAVTFIAIYRQLGCSGPPPRWHSWTTSRKSGVRNGWIARPWPSFSLSRQASMRATSQRHRCSRSVTTSKRWRTWSGREPFDVRLVNETLSGQVQTWWARIRPAVLAWRARTGVQDTYSSVEELATTMARMDAGSGRSIRTDDDYLTTRLPRVIAQARDSIEMHEALRAVPVHLTSVPVPVRVVGDGA